MAPRQQGDTDPLDAELARFSKKLDGYEAMGLDVDDLRQLLEEDIDEFKATYLGVIRTQLEGGKEEAPDEGPAEEEEAPVEVEAAAPPEEPSEDEVPEDEGGEQPPGTPVDEEVPEAQGPDEVEEPSEELADEEAEEEMELQLEGAGPEEALAATDIPDDEPVEEEEALEEEEDGEKPPEEEPEVVEGPPEEEEVEEEAEIEVGETPEEETEEPEEEVPEGTVEEEEALIVVAEVIEEEEEEGPPEEEMETEVRLSGIIPLDRGEEEAPEEEEGAPEPSGEPEPEPEPPRPKMVKKVVPKKTVPKEGTTKKPPAKKTPPKKEPAKKAPPKGKTPAKKKAPTPPPKKRPLNRIVIAIFVVALVVIASSASYFLFLKNEDPIALFTFDPSSPVVGQVVTFDARNSYDPDDGTIEKYVWSFGDGTSGAGRVAKHSFIEAKGYRVRLTVEDDRGARATTQRTVEVEALEVSMGLPFEGDWFQYAMEGELTLSNYVDGLYEFKGPTGETEYIYAIVAPTVDGEKVFEVTGLRTAKDGLMRDHENARIERTFYDLDDIKGTIETSMAANPSFTGTVEATVEEDVCQHWERGIRSSVEVYADFKAVFAGQDWATLSTWDEGAFYTQLTGIDETFSLNEFLRNTTFSSEDREKHELSIGESTYVWQVRGMERVEDRLVPALHINMTMDMDTLQANNLDNFYIDVWLEPGLSQPSKYHVYVKGQEEGNRFKVDMTEVLDTGTMGTEAASGRPCGIDHEYTIKDDEYPEDFNQLSRVPERGGTAGGFIISPREAYDEAYKDDDFRTYASGHANAFFHLGHYAESGSQGRWVMDFGQKGSSDHRKVDAKYNNEWDITVKDFVDVSLPLSSNASIGEVVTLSRGIRLLRAEPEIAALCFDGQDPDWSSYTFNVTEGVSTLSLDPTSVLVGSQETGYVYMLVSKGGPILHRAALDATNGQVLFTWKHTEEFHTFEGFG